MNLGLAGKVALVSGASRGIGFAIAAALAAEGCRLIITAREAGPLAFAAERLQATAGSGNVLALTLDMADEAAVQEDIAQAEAHFGAIDVAVANAGSGRAANGLALERADWQVALEANLFPSALLASAILPRMVARRRGSLVLVSSIAGCAAIGAPLPYAAAKAALNLAVKSWARQVGACGVRVNGVAPGNVLFPGGSWAEKMTTAEGLARASEMIAREVPLRRFATPREIADCVVFLASARASFVHGTLLAVDGGQLQAP